MNVLAFLNSTFDGLFPASTTHPNTPPRTGDVVRSQVVAALASSAFAGVVNAIPHDAHTSPIWQVVLFYLGYSLLAWARQYVGGPQARV